jgi:hypothetical protein
VAAFIHKNLQLQILVLDMVYESLYRDIHGSAHHNTVVSYAFIVLYPEIENIYMFDCADPSSARRYRKMCSRFETAAHLGRTIRTFLKYFKIVFATGTSLQQLLARNATAGRNTTTQQRSISLDDAFRTSNECERSPRYPHARHQLSINMSQIYECVDVCGYR